MAEDIRHRGFVRSIEGNRITVAVTEQNESCDGCKIALICGQKNDKSQVTVDADPTGLAVGDEVELSPMESSQWRGILMAFVVPIVVMMALILGLTAFGANEPTALIIAIAAVGVYYVILYLFRERVSSGLKWKIRKTN